MDVREAQGRQLFHRPVAGARFGFGRGEALTDFRGQPLGDVPGVVIIVECVVAERRNLWISDDGRRKRGDRLLG